MKRRGLLLFGSILLALVLVTLPLLSACKAEEGPTAAEAAAEAAAAAAAAAERAEAAIEEAVGEAAKEAARAAAAEARKAAEEAAAKAEEKEVTPEKPIKILYSTSSSPTPGTVAALQVELFEKMEEATGGRVVVEAHWASELYSDKEAAIAFKNGILQLGGGSCYTLDAFDKRWSLFLLPFVFNDPDHLGRFLGTDAWHDFERDFELQGFKAILGPKWNSCTMGAEGKRAGYNFFANFDMSTLENWAGKKVRVQTTPVLIKLAECLGFHGEPISISELPMALATGMVDGVLGYMSTTWVNKLRYQEYMDYVLEDLVNISPQGQYWNTAWYYGLPDDIREILDELMYEYIEEASANSVIRGEEAWDIVAGACIAQKLSPEEKAKWREAIEPLYAEFREKEGFPALFAAAEAAR